MNVREARLDDLRGIAALFQARIPVWQRIDEQGRVQDVAYETLTIYERWLHGGAWMSLETAALHLGRLLLGAGVALVADVDGQIVGYAEAYHSIEAVGTHLSIAHLITAHDDVDDHLFAMLKKQAKALKCQALSIAIMGAESDFFQRQGMTAGEVIRRYSLPARTGQVFYKASDHPDSDAAQIAGWHLTVGRTLSSRQHWETGYPPTWDVLPEIKARRAFRLKFNAAGTDALVLAQPQLYNPRALDLCVWSPKPLTTQLLAALRDWAHREGFRALVMPVSDEVAKTLGAEAEPDGYTVTWYGVGV